MNETKKPGDELMHSLAHANDNNWENFAFNIEEFLDAGNSVIVIGRYAGYNRASGKPMSAAATHVYDLRDGKVSRFRMFADTKIIWDAADRSYVLLAIKPASD